MRYWFAARHLSVLLVVLLLASAAHAHGDLDGQIADATRQIDEAPPDSPRLAFLYFQRGELYRLHGEWTRAEADFDAAERRDPEGKDAKLRDLDFARGRLYLEWNRPEQAKAALERYLTRWGDDAEALMAHARTLLALGWGVQAVDYLDKAILRHPQPEPDHFLARAEVLERLGPKHLERALAGLDQGIRLLGPIVTLEEKAMAIELGLERFDAALARVDGLLRSQARRDLWLARRGDILARAGRARLARRAYRDALAALDGLPASIRRHKDTVELRQRLLGLLED